MRYFHRHTLAGAVVHLMWLLRKTRNHVINHRHKYISGGMIHLALVVFVGDAAAAAMPLPHVVLVVIHTQKTWAVPIAAALGHIGFMLERAADQKKHQDKLDAAAKRIAELTRAHERRVEA
jgi:hypothetical protein